MPGSIRTRMQRIYNTSQAESIEKIFSLRAHPSQQEEDVLVFLDGAHLLSTDDKVAAASFIASLKACAKQKDLHRGSRIHTDAVRSGLLERDVYVGSTLVNMYAKCGELEKSQEVFDQLPVRNIVTWNVLIAGYTQLGYGWEALKCFECMQQGGFSPDPFTFSCILKACSSVRAVEKGQEVHAQISRERLLSKDIVVGNALIDMYTKCGVLEKAHKVFDELPIRNVVSWNALISGYSQQGYGREALNHFEKMKSKGVVPDAVTFTSILKACGTARSLDKGQEMHAQIMRENLLEKNAMLANALIEMYAKCGALAKAQEVFDKLPVRNAVLWTALIAGYAQNGQGREALDCYEQMNLGGFHVDVVTLACILKACCSIGDLSKGEEIHAHVVRESLLETNTVLANALIDMYVGCCALDKAQDVLDELQIKDLISWTALIGGYVQFGYGQESISCFERMLLEGLSPDRVAFAFICKACGSVRALAKGQEIHARVMHERLLDKHAVVANAVVDMYASCGALRKAQEVFDELPFRNTVSWNALISGHFQQGHSKEALKWYEQMQLQEIPMDAVTFGCILKACGSLGALDKGQEIHAEIVRQLPVDTNILVANALVDMYAKSGAPEKAREVFDDLPVRDTILWTALIAGYYEQGCGEEALSCFDEMQLDELQPDAISFCCILKVCGGVGAAYNGQLVHAEIVRHELLDEDTSVGIALVEMYANCGMLPEAQVSFDRLRVQNVVSWSVLMVGYSQLGKDDMVFRLFDKMLEEGIVPDSVMFTILLNTCSHRGLLDRGQMYFKAISAGFGMIPTLEHHTIMIDLFGRAGHLDKAIAVIEEMPLSANLTMWHTLLGACRKLTDMKLGRWAFEQLHEKDAAAYVCMGDIYAATAGAQLKPELSSMAEPKLYEVRVS